MSTVWLVSDMTVELPKDAEGREIPLDTKVLYDLCGTKVSVKEFLFRTLVESQKTEWTIEAQYEGNMYYNSFKPENMHLTQPDTDSWEKLEKDLDSCSVSTQYSPCAYFSDSTGSCEKCPANPNEECLVQMVKHITLRIHKLRGED
ncbi:Uncharacterised protein [Collinsella aerofaciens]|uniref:Uncharacterized protein n=2 Tax=Collinsella aerofaciens TaxID=74426 RepID=A0A5K1JD24_9ACTN|nr:Uncharacterised protein [Collinsella aerofaciens]